MIKEMHISAEAKNLRFGYYISIITAALTLITFVIAFLTPPLSGPFCKSGCYQYPFLDIASRFPRDYYWMYPAMLLALLYLAFVISASVISEKDKKISSLFAMAAAMLSAGILLADYFIQVSVVQASLINNEHDGISLLTQFNPHGIFIVLEELGFILMSISFLAMAPLFEGSGLERAIRRIFIISFITMTSAFLWITFSYGLKREYMFEVAVISINWLTLIISGILRSILYRRKLKEVQKS